MTTQDFHAMIQECEAIGAWKMAEILRGMLAKLLEESSEKAA